MRIDDEFVVDKEKIEDENEITLYDKDGNICDIKDKFLMKQVGKKYFVMFHRSEIVDPLGDNAFLRNYNDLTLKKISAKAARYYLRYLKEKNSRYFILCRRNLDA